MKHNPLGMVPTLVSEATFKADPNLGPMKPPVSESLIAIEFVDELVNKFNCDEGLAHWRFHRSKVWIRLKGRL